MPSLQPDALLEMRRADLRLCLLSMARHQLCESLLGQPCHVRRVSEHRWQVDGLPSVELDEAVRMLIRPTVTDACIRPGETVQ